MDRMKKVKTKSYCIVYNDIYLPYKKNQRERYCISKLNNLVKVFRLYLCDVFQLKKSHWIEIENKQNIVTH